MWFLLLVLGSLGLFMYGMRTLSSGLQKAAGENLRALVNRLAYNDFSGLLTGTVLTFLVQSSTATSILFVGLANAGLINLRQSIVLILGANIGTTFKALLLVYSGLSINLESIALLFAAFGLLLLFSQRNTLKSLADIFMGLALMLISVNLIKNSLEHVEENQYLKQLLVNASQMGFTGNLIALATGMVLTMIVQSSSAIMTLTLLLSQKGILSFEMASAMIIGENIGTTITANLAAIVANKNAKRVALWHTLFNCFGALWVMLLFYPILNALAFFVENSLNHGNPYTSNEARTFALAFLHLGFNLTNALILIGFAPQIEKLLVKIIPDRHELNEPAFSLQYMQSGLIRSPELAVLEVNKAIEQLAVNNHQMFKISELLLTRNENTDFYNNLKHIRDLDSSAGKLNSEISNFLNKVTESDISKSTSNTIRAYFAATQELHALSGLIQQVSKVYERKLLQRIWFSQHQRESIKALDHKLNELFNDMIVLLQKGEFESMSAYFDRKSNFLFMCEELKDKHLESIDEADFNVKSGTIYIDLLNLHQRIGEQVVAVCARYKS